MTDIQTAITKVYKYRSSLNGPYSEMAVSAILREIGSIIGEAVNALPEDITAKRPEISWRQIAAMRNFLVHEYFNIDQAVVEDVITKLPVRRQQMRVSHPNRTAAISFASRPDTDLIAGSRS